MTDLHLDEPVGAAPPPQEIEHKVDLTLRYIRRLATVALLFLVVAFTFYLANGYFRGRDIQEVVTSLDAENGPEAQAVSQAYLALIRLQIDCDGRFREQESDNVLLAQVSQALPGVSFDPVDLASEAKSCKGIPAAEKKLAEAARKLEAARREARGS